MAGPHSTPDFWPGWLSRVAPVALLLFVLFSAIVTTEVGVPGAAIFYCFIPTNIASWAFCPNFSVSVNVELALEAQGRTYRGKGEDSFIDHQDSGMTNSTSDWRAVVHNAFQQAMMQALEESKTGPSKNAAKR